MKPEITHGSIHSAWGFGFGFYIAVSLRSQPKQMALDAKSIWNPTILNWIMLSWAVREFFRGFKPTSKR
jgi:hypothetical protein